MKRVICVLLLFLLLPASAGAAGTYILDGAGFLTAEETTEISRLLQAVKMEYGLDVMVVTEREMRLDEARETAQDYARQYAVDGLLLYIARSPREYYFYNRGEGETVYTDRGMARIEKAVLPYLKEERYGEACKVFAEEAEALAAMAADGKPYDAPPTKTVVVTVLCVLLLPLLIAFLMVRAKRRQMMTARPEPYARNYVEDGSFRLDTSRDLYLYSTIVKTPRPKPSSHSGSSYGGRGGKY